MVKVVNGFVCSSGCDERLAKKNIDPRNPRNDPVKQERLDQSDPSKANKKAIEESTEARLDPKRNSAVDREVAVVFGGSLGTDTLSASDFGAPLDAGAPADIGGSADAYARAGAIAQAGGSGSVDTGASATPDVPAKSETPTETGNSLETGASEPAQPPSASDASSQARDRESPQTATNTNALTDLGISPRQALPSPGSLFNVYA